MSIFKCKMCGGTIEFEQGATVGICDSCGTKQTLPRLDDERRANLYDRANHFRRNNEFDKAAGIYEQILTEDTTDAEAYWSLVLCRYGIEYVEDPATHRRVPTVNRAQFTSIFDDDNYKSALQYADLSQRLIYEEEAAAINEIQKGILAISQKEEPFDVFICYKETDANGRRTQDSVLANELYHQLTQEGFKVFFSRITLEDKLGTAYEPYIFAALNSAKVMVVLGTKPEHFNAVWVKNEWSRYLSIVKAGGGKKILIPAYKDMDPYDLPEEFSHLQAQDMSKLGFMQDLIRGIRKIVTADEPKTTVKETVIVGGNANVAPLLRRAFMFLEDGDWARADEFCEQVLNQEPENAQAYLGKLMAELHVHRQEDLPNCKEPFDNSPNFKKAVRFGGEELAFVLHGYITHINERNENKRLTDIYNRAVDLMNGANSSSKYYSAVEAFKSISGFKDADLLAKQCLEKAEIYEKNKTYERAKQQMNVNYQMAVNIFRTIPGWKDSDELVIFCQKRIEELKAQEEARRLERERKAEEDRIERERKAEEERIERERKEEEERLAAENAKKKKKKVIAITIPILVACIAFVVLLLTVIMPKQKLNKAMAMLEAGDYENAYALLEEIGDHDDLIESSKYERAMALIDSDEYFQAHYLLEEVDIHDDLIETSVYERAMSKLDSGDYSGAYTLLDWLGKTEEIERNKYDRAMALIESEEYETAYGLLEEIGYIGVISKNKYDRAVALLDSGEFLEASRLLEGLDYNDSKEQLEKCYAGMVGEEYYLKPGDTYVFGEYEQDNDISNGSEEIEWIVLEKDGFSVLLMSKYALDSQPFNTSLGDVTWETSSLRYWLNTTFFLKAFKVEERNMIKSTIVTADRNPKFDTPPGESTTDKVYLLSILEVQKYQDMLEVCKCQGTEYCYAMGAGKATDMNQKVIEGNYVGQWWLRTPSSDTRGAASVWGGGGDESIRSYGSNVDYSGYAVRPVIWIDFSGRIVNN